MVHDQIIFAAVLHKKRLCQRSDHFLRVCLRQFQKLCILRDFRLYICLAGRIGRL